MEIKRRNQIIDVTDKAIRPLTRKTNPLPAWVTSNGLIDYLI